MIEVRDLLVELPAFALNRISFHVPDHAYCTLMGETGSGKTTILESICGLKQPQGGKVFLAGRDITQAKPGERNIGYVPQDGALFPTMRVRDQIEFGMRLRKWTPTARRDRIEELADLLEITPLLSRKPHGLSGGERQRVALGRAMAFRPRVLCLDEPLSALDESTRERMHVLLKRCHQHEQTTVLHVTHSTAETKMLATYQLILRDGQIHPGAGMTRSTMSDSR